MIRAVPAAGRGMAGQPADPPPYVQRILAYMESLDLEPVSTPGRAPADGAPTLVCVLRDELDRLPAFVEHHQSLGVRDFVFMDNGSEDGTREWLTRQPGVTLYQVDQPFGETAKQAWINHAIRQRDPGGWYLVLDADERVVFDGNTRHDLAALTTTMEGLGLTRVRGMLVDLYPPGPLVAPGADDDRPHALFDATGYTETTVRRMVSRTGGPRRRAFSLEGEALAPELTKYPLFRASRDSLMANPHHLFPYEANFESPCYLGILHEKFRYDFQPRIRRAVDEGQYWRGSLEYRAYAATLEREPGLSLEYEGSRAYRGPDDLVKAGLVESLNWG